LVRIIVDGKELFGFSTITVDLLFNAFASTFSFDGEKDIVPKLLKFQVVEIFHENTLLLTGVVLSHNLSSGKNPTLRAISGYSITGKLQDCSLPLIGSSEYTSTSILEVSELASQLLGIKTKFDDDASDAMNAIIPKIIFEPGESYKKSIESHATQKGLYITHTPQGELLYKKGDISKQSPVLTFTDKNTESMSLLVNGQMMHSDISVLRQATIDDLDSFDYLSGDETIKNPLIEGIQGSYEDYFFGDENSDSDGVPVGLKPIPSSFRPIVILLKDGDPLDAKTAARAKLASELKEVKLTISAKIFVNKGEVINVRNEEIEINNNTEFFIEAVNIKEKKDSINYVYTCVLKGVYTNEEVKNVFE